MLSFMVLALALALCLVAAVRANLDPEHADLPAPLPKNHAWRNSAEAFVELHAGLSERLGTLGFTLEAWVYNENPTSGNNQPIIAHADAGASDVFHADYVLQINKNNGRISFVMGAGPDTYGFVLQGGALQLNEWTHIAVTVAAPHAGDPTSARLYVNGELVAEADSWQGEAASRQISADPITLGYSDLGGERSHFRGQLDEVRFWATVRSQAAIQRDMKDPFLFSDPTEIPGHLIAYYSFDAGPDDVVWDNSDQPYYDGKVVGGVQERVQAEGVVDIPLSPTFAPYAGPLAMGLQFNGFHEDRNYVRLPDSLSRDLPRGFTFEAWIYLEAPTVNDQHYKTIVSRFNAAAAAEHPGTFESGSNPEADFVFQVDPRNGRLVFFMGGGRGDCERNSLGYGIALFSSGEYNVNAYEWTHVAFSVFSSTDGDPFSARMYVNGKEVPQAPELPGNEWHADCTRNYFRASEPVYLGFYDNGIQQYWDGRIDEVRFWDEPREDADIARDYIKPIPANATPGLLAYYLLNDGEGTDIRDSTPHRHDGTAQQDDWVLSQSPAELLDGVSGFPVHVMLQANSPYPEFPNDDTFTYVITHLPESGGLFTTDTPIQLIEAIDLENNRAVTEQMTYVSDVGYTGFDYFGYAAVSATTGLQSETHYVYIHVQPYEVPDNICQFYDACGVCNGDGTSCTGGCDGKGGEVDVCGVCGGEGASCTCVYYKTFHTDELDCVLLQNQVNVTMARVTNSVSTLSRTIMALETFDQDSWRSNFFDLGLQVEFLCRFLNGCLPPYEQRLSEFEETLQSEFATCEPVPQE